jgi:hypothetical protein
MDERQHNEGIPEFVEHDDRQILEVAHDEGMDDEEWEAEDDEPSDRSAERVSSSSRGSLDNLADHATGIADGKHVVRDIACNDAARADH